MIWRTYDARMKVTDMLEAYRALVASRQAKLLQQLTAMGMVSARVGRLLAKSRLVNQDFIPDMPEKPLLPPGLVEAFKEAKIHRGRKKEANQMMQKRQTWLNNERQSRGAHTMRFRRMFAPRKITSYILSKLFSRTSGVVRCPCV